MTDKLPYEVLYGEACALHRRAMEKIRAIRPDRGRARFEQDWECVRLYLAADAEKLEGILRKLEPIIPKEVLNREEVRGNIRVMVSFLRDYLPK